MHLSKGGLHMPDSNFLEACKAFDRLFVAFHGHEVDQEEMVIDRFYQKLAEAFGRQWPEDVLALFARVRTFIRIKALNKYLQVDEASAKFRKLKQYGQHST